MEIRSFAKRLAATTVAIGILSSLGSAAHAAADADLFLRLTGVDGESSADATMQVTTRFAVQSGDAQSRRDEPALLINMAEALRTSPTTPRSTDGEACWDWTNEDGTHGTNCNGVSSPADGGGGGSLVTLTLTPKSGASF